MFFYYQKEKKKMDLNKKINDKNDIDNLQSKKKQKKNLSIIEEQFDNAEHIVTRYLRKFIKLC